MARSRGAYGSALARDSRGFFASLKNDRGALRMALRCLCGSLWLKRRRVRGGGARALMAGGRRFFGFAQNDRGRGWDGRLTGLISEGVRSRRHGYESPLTTGRMAMMCSGPVAQQPPII